MKLTDRLSDPLPRLYIPSFSFMQMSAQKKGNDVVEGHARLEKTDVIQCSD
jgi:hypothetical protein